MDYVLWSAVGLLVLAGGAMGVVLFRHRRARRESEERRRRKAAFEGATVDVHTVDRLSLADAALVQPPDPGLPYVFRLEVTIRPAGDVSWGLQELDVVGESDDAPGLDLDLQVRLIGVEPVGDDIAAGPVVGQRRLRITARTRGPSPTLRVVCAGAVFGNIGTIGATVTTTRRIPASLHAAAVVVNMGPLPEHVDPRPRERAPDTEPVIQAFHDPNPTPRIDLPPAVRPATPPPRPAPVREPVSAWDEPAPHTAILGGSAIAPRRARPAPPRA